MATPRARRSTKAAVAEEEFTEAPVIVIAEEANRDALMRSCYQQAIKQLKANHEDEWNALLDSAYAGAGLEVRRRLTEDEKAAREAAKLEEKRAKLLAALAEVDEKMGAQPLFEVEDPFAS